MSLEMAHKVIVPQKKIMSRSFLNSGCTALLKAEFFIEPPPDTQRKEDEEKEE